jgi:DeoR/GlpR family transcriptional regulator of sugar metabolism
MLLFAGYRGKHMCYAASIALQVTVAMSGPDLDINSGDLALPAKRRSDIVRLVKQIGQITVVDMSARFEVSVDTIRRDLDILAEQGLVSRTHGGAVPMENRVTADTPLDFRLNAQHSAKTSIGRTAARLISPGETLVINGGSTTIAFASSLVDLSRLTIVTNNLSLPAAVPPACVSGLYLLGGEIRSGANITLGSVGFVGTGKITADTAVIGVGGITPEGCSTSHIEEATMMAAMISAARRTIIVADSSKFGRLAFAMVTSLDRIDVLVTDGEPPFELKESLEAAGVKTIIAN